ncbi:thiaminase II [Marinomonas gallaica]|uniref:thiaminase II n=1 Tax=Marinomonas gallaica TaxID=1806667 RepID=UPI00082C30EE|nr:thiaminase II [Marinomonas gallaica]
MEYQDLVDACSDEWQAYIEHDFVLQIADGSLDERCFLHYLKQDFLFLKHYVRAYALAIYKADNLEDMRRALPSVQALLDTEIAHHVAYCKKWGISEAEMEQEDEAFGTVAYTRFVLDSGMSGDLTSLYAALAPCSIGYAAIGNQRMQSPDTKLDGNPFRSWLDLYASEDFQSHVAQGAQHFNSLLADIELNSKQGQRLVETFRTATRMEIAFWQQGFDHIKQEG